MSAPSAGAGEAGKPSWLDAVAFNAEGLVPVIAQSAVDGQVLMLAWADRSALEHTLASGLATYYSRSRQRQWRKGEESGNTQQVREIRLDCDGDALLYLVEQNGGIACHTGRANCFFRRLDQAQWHECAPVLRDPGQLYGQGAP